MSDLISRTGAIAHFDKVAEELDEQRGDDSWVGNAFKICLLGVVNDLAVLPSAEPQWIPVSERLPERNEIVLVSYKTTNKVHMCKYLDDGSENPWWSYNDDCLAWNNVILAWMPLPPSYEGGETV